jgi:RNA polymerase sigma-70 factor, ECF subfamily
MEGTFGPVSGAALREEAGPVRATCDDRLLTRYPSALCVGNAFCCTGIAAPRLGGQPRGCSDAATEGTEYMQTHKAQVMHTAAVDPNAFAALYERHFATIWAYARRHSASAEDAEDIAAQTFLKAWVAIDRYEERGAPIIAWLIRIAANLLHEQARRQSCGVRRASVTWNEEISRTAPEEEWLERWEQRAWVGAHLATLSRDQRRALRLRFGEDRPMREVAARLGRSDGATRMLLHRTLRTLHTRMAAEAIGPHACEAGWRALGAGPMPYAGNGSHAPVTAHRPPNAASRPHLRARGDDRHQWTIVTRGGGAPLQASPLSVERLPRCGR